MIAFARRWLSGDERTLGAFLLLGVLTMAFFRLHTVREYLGVGADPLPFLVVAVAVTWWSLLPRSFVWLDPADLTWRDFGDTDRAKTITERLTGFWLGRQLALAYLLAVLAAVVAAPAGWVVAGAVLLAGAGLLALATVRLPRTGARAEAAVVVGAAVAAVVARPGPTALCVAGGVLAVAAFVWLRPGTPLIAYAARPALVDGWRDRVLRSSGVQFLDVALLLPPARPARPWRLTGGLRLAWSGVLGRARHVPTAVLLAVVAIAVQRTFRALPDLVVFAALGYLAVVPLMAGLGELWRSPGRRRWLATGDAALRAHHLLVALALALTWAVPVFALADWEPDVLVTIPVVAACAIRTMTRKPPTYDNLVPVDSPFGAMPVRLVLQTLRGPDLGILAIPILQGLNVWGALVLVAAVLALAAFR